MLLLFSDFDNKLKECIENSKVVLDISWEMINTGHWKDVDPNWRYAFTFGSLFKVLCLLLDEKANKFVCNVLASFSYILAHMIY